MEKTPQQVAATERLRRWAVSPAGGGKLFNWGVPGDYQRCVDFYKTKMPDIYVHGWCANLHRLATGRSPGHAPGIEQAQADAKKAANKSR